MAKLPRTRSQMSAGAFRGVTGRPCMSRTVSGDMGT